MFSAINKIYLAGFIFACFLKLFSVVLFSESERFSIINTTYHQLAFGNFYQDWSDMSLISINNDWSNVPSIVGFGGAIATTSTTGRDPQTILQPFSDLNVRSNSTNISSSDGGVFEFNIANPTVSLQPSGGFDAPNIVIHLNTVGVENIKVSYLLRDIDTTSDNSIQPVALQYRIGEEGDFINLPSGFVGDASKGPSDTLNTLVQVILPLACSNQPQLQLRIISWNAAGFDEHVGIDNIDISAVSIVDCSIDTIDVINGLGVIHRDSFLASYLLTENQRLYINGLPASGPQISLSCINGDFPVNILIVEQYGNEVDTIAECTKILHAPVAKGNDPSSAVLGEINLSLGENCEAIVTPLTFLTNVTSCVGNIQVELVYPSGTNSYASKNKLDFTHIGAKVKFILTLPDGQNLWGYINVEEKRGPNLVMPKDSIYIFCFSDTDTDETGVATAHNCTGNLIVFYTDLVTDIKCESDTAQVIKVIKRVWSAKDKYNNITIDTQTIFVKALPLTAIKGPVALAELACGENPTPARISSLKGFRSAAPFYRNPLTGSDRTLRTYSGGCNFQLTYNDIIILENVCKENCKANKKFLRKWTVIDWCVGRSMDFNQIIKLVDKVPPIIEISDIPDTFYTNTWSCNADINLPSTTVRDNCDPDAQLVEVKDSLGLIAVTKTSSGWRALKVPCGRTKFYYTASDCCGNTSRDSVVITVVDRVAPVATAKEFITVSLTRSGDPTVTGVAKLYAEQVDNGSFDNCTKVFLEVRREDGSPKCLNEGEIVPIAGGQTYNNNLSYNNNLNVLDKTIPKHIPEGSEYDTDRGEFVKFCCEDVGKEVKVWLRVWDDAGKDGIFGNDGDNYNEAWTTVKVEDKSIPKIFCKPDVTLICDIDTGLITEYNFTSAWESTSGKVPPSLVPKAESVCNNLEFEFQDRGSLTVCNTGKFTRIYRIKSHPTVNCTQVIHIANEFVRPKLEWPIVLHEWNKCTLTEEDVENNTVRARINIDKEFNLDGCISMVRVEKGSTSRNGLNCSADVLDLCKQGTGSTALWNEDPTMPYNVIPSDVTTCGDYGGRPEPESTVTSNPTTPSGYPRFNSNYKDPGCNVFGKKIYIEEYTVGEGCRKWLVRWDYINWCCNEKSACRETIYKYEDKTAPEIVNCPGDDQVIIDGSCVIASLLNPVAVDSGGCESGLTWRVRIYPNNKSGTGQYVEIIKTGFNLASQSAITTTILAGTSPSLTITNIPEGEHGVRYLVTDGCGNVSECTSVIGVWPKAATPYCVSLSSAVMKNGLVELWARDFDRGSFTNCGSRALYFTFNRGGNAEHPSVNPAHLTYEHYFTGLGNFLAFRTANGNSTGETAAKALYDAGNAQLWLPDVTVRPRPTLPNGDPQQDERILIGGSSGMQFGCKAASGLGPVTVEMRVWDSGSFKAGTTQGSDFCSTRLTLIDNLGGCGQGTLVSLGGVIQTEGVEMMRSVDVLLKAELPEYPQSIRTNEEGKYEFKNLPINIDYSIEAKKENDYLNGVNTLDLVQIQRHILGIQKLSNPYKMIAADADGDKAVRVNDIVTLRKMILGMTDKLEGIPSWRFIDASDKMENGPWPFREVISHTELHEAAMKNNFVGVKIGDVDGTASANVASKTSQTRNVGVRLTAEDREVKTGEEVEITLKAETFTDVYGMQMSIIHKSLELLRIDGRAIELTEEHFGKVRKDLTTVSWSSDKANTVAKGNEVMKLTFRVMKPGKLSEMIQITNEVINAEAYTGQNMENGVISLEISHRDGQFSVLNVNQNEPNPWKSSTLISYNLPEEGFVRLSISDVTGRSIRTYNFRGNAGENTLTINREQLNGATGILIYKIESGSISAQKKMLVVE